MQRIVGLVHEAVGEAGLATPVLAGHSQSGGFASVYAAQYPASGVINLEASPDLWTFVQVIQGLAASCGGDMLEVWQKMEQTFGLRLLPAETREFIMRHSRPTRDLLASYWEDIFAMTPEQASAMMNGAVRRDHRGRGALPADPRVRALARYRRLVRERRAARDRRGLGGQRALPAHRAPSEVRRATSGYRVSTAVRRPAGRPGRRDTPTVGLGKDPALRAGDRSGGWPYRTGRLSCCSPAGGGPPGTSLISSLLSSAARILANRWRASRRPSGNLRSSRAPAAACRGCARAAAGDRSPSADAHRRAFL